MNNIGKYLLHPSTLALITINLVTLVFAFFENWNVYVILLLYVIQGLCIGFFHYLKILRLTNFDTTNFSKEFEMEINGTKVSVDGLPQEKAKRTAANAFLAGFFIFHAVYIVFIFAFSTVTNNTTWFTSKGIFSIWFFIIVLGYFINHGISFILSKDEATKRVSLGKYLDEPMARIVPIHLAIVFGGFFIGAFGGEFILLALFLLFKTILDVWLHVKQHEPYQSGQI